MKNSFAGKRPATKLTQIGKDRHFDGGQSVNPPVVRASTVLFETVEQQAAFRARRDDEQVFTYGSYGTPTTFALENAVAELEGGYRTRLFPTGLSAAAMVFLAYLEPGDHVLIVDSVYEPVRSFSQQFLKPYGIEFDYFSPDIPDIGELFRPRTKLVYTECPGSLVFEMCDLPAIASVARSRGARVAVDNTWGSGLLYRPLTLGADISVMAATKYLGGHSDVMMGTVTTNESAWRQLQDRCNAFGVAVSPDDAWLVLRGMRTLAARMTIHERNAHALMEWLGMQPEVVHVHSPAMPGHPGHDLWLRDCHGTNGLLSFELEPEVSREDAQRLANALKLFGVGSSWGGYESLVSLPNLVKARTMSDWGRRGPVVRLHAGLEDEADLIADLEVAFEALRSRR